MALIVLILAGAWVVIAAVAAHFITRPKPKSYWDGYTYTPWEVGIPFESVRFPTREGLTLAGWLCERPGSPTAIVCVSGYKQSKADLLGLAKGLWSAGHTVLLLDFRGQWESEGEATLTLGEREPADLQAAADYLTARFPGIRLGVFGFSMGGAVALMAAARDPRWLALVADSAYADQIGVIATNFHRVSHLPAGPFLPLIRGFIRLRAGYDPAAVRPVEVIGQIAPRPVLLIHGEADDYVPFSHAGRLAAAAGPTASLWATPGVFHCGTYFHDRAAYVNRVVAFFSQILLLPGLQTGSWQNEDNVVK